MSLFYKILGFFTFCIIYPSLGQKLQESHQLQVKKTDTPIKLDGILDEDIWTSAVPIGDFWEKYPSDKNKAELKTVVKAVYNDKYLYFSLICYDKNNKYIAPSLKRDGSIREADGIAIILDPINKKSNGFGFATTPYNVQSEYQFGASTGSGELNTAWDNKWFSEVTRTDSAYIIEIAIPFKTLRYDSKTATWGINFIRSDQKNNKFYTWTNVPVQFPGFDLGYLGALVFEEQLPATTQNISLIPYIITRTSTDAENSKDLSATFNAGFDAKVSLSSSLNLDLTLNPDFSQVDVDQQVTNLTRFNVFFPERRTFFLENDDLFSNYGAPPFRPFFSRRIGIDENNQPIPILYGAKISGNLSKNLRIGAFNMQTRRKNDFAAQNYSVVSLVQRIGIRSSIKVYGHNRTGFLTDKEKTGSPLDQYGRNAGLELNLSNATGKLSAWGGYHISKKAGIVNNNNFYQLGGGYFGQKFNTFIDYGKFGQNYYADLGFINRIETFSKVGNNYSSADTTIRAGFSQMFNDNSYTLRPTNGIIVTHKIGLSNFLSWYQDGGISEKLHSITYNATFKNTASSQLEFNFQQDNLRYYFKLPSEKPLIPGTYNYNNVFWQLKTDNRKNLLLTSSLRVGQFYNGKIQQFRTLLTVRNQPWWSVAVLAEYNKLIFPKEFGNTKFWLFSPKTELNFSNKIFWTTFFQYNSQANNVNINSRLQYRYSPMSDLFIVYSDNYYTDPLFKNKNRAIVVKFNYWLNL